jgi:adenosine kinase
MILVSGSLAFDQIMDFPGVFSDHIMPDKLHTLNVSFLVDNMRKGYGGTAGNIAYSLALLEIPVGILGMVGKDFDEYRKFLVDHQVNMDNVHIDDDLFSASAFGITDNKDNNIWGYYMGADMTSDKLSLSDVKGKVDFGIIAPQNPRAMLKFATEYAKMHIPFLFDPGMQLPWFSGTDMNQVFADAEIIIGNDYEIAVMEMKTGIKPLDKLSKSGKIIITTLGEKGSQISHNGDVIFIEPAKVISTCDPAGAGDAFRSGFIAGYMRKLPLKTCGQMGSITSAYTVEKYGTSTHFYTTKQFCKRYEDNYHEDLAL